MRSSFALKILPNLRAAYVSLNGHLVLLCPVLNYSHREITRKTANFQVAFPSIVSTFYLVLLNPP